MDIDARTELIQALIPLGLWHLKEALEQGVKMVAGEQYPRQGMTGYDRWVKRWRSVYRIDQKVPILVPRVRDRQAGKEIRLRIYERLRESRNGNEGVLKRIPIVSGHRNKKSHSSLKKIGGGSLSP
jgi:hypothetical protein